MTTARAMMNSSSSPDNHTTFQGRHFSVDEASVQTCSGPHSVLIRLIKKQRIHTQVLESGVRPYPHNGLVCSPYLGGGTKTQESLTRRGAGSPVLCRLGEGGSLTGVCLPGWGQGRAKVSQHRARLFPPESRPSLEKAGSRRPPHPGLHTLTGVSVTFPLFGSSRRGGEPTRVTTVFKGPGKGGIKGAMSTQQAQHGAGPGDG